VKLLLIIFNVVAALATLLMIGFGGATSSAYFIVAMNALCVLIVATDKGSSNTSMIDQQLIRLRRLAIRLSYLQDEGCLTQKGGEVIFDFHGDDTAAAEALAAIDEIARIGR
jgi:hypothetical protein